MTQLVLVCNYLMRQITEISEHQRSSRSVECEKVRPTASCIRVHLYEHEQQRCSESSALAAIQHRRAISLVQSNFVFVSRTATSRPPKFVALTMH